MQDGDPPPDAKESPRPPAPLERLRTSEPPRPRPSQAPRPSQFPVQPFRGAWRVVFAVLWGVVQVGLVLTADRRLDAAFGFRTFTESTVIRMVLYREVITPGGHTTRIHVEDGVWSANDAGGLRRRFAWTDRVRRRELAVFDEEINATSGARATLSRLQAALDDVATHTADDAETRRFFLEISVRRNGSEAYVVQLASVERRGGGT